MLFVKRVKNRRNYHFHRENIAISISHDLKKLRLNAVKYNVHLIRQVQLTTT